MSGHDNIEKLNYTYANDYFIALRDYALTKGINARGLIANTDLSLAYLLNPPLRIDHESMAQVLENVVLLASPYQQVALEFGSFIALRSHGMLGIAVQSGKNLRDVCELLCSFMKVKVQGILVQISESPAGITLLISNDPCYSPPDSLTLVHAFELLMVANFDYFCSIAIEQKPINSPMIFRLTQPQPQNFNAESYSSLGKIKFNQPQLGAFIPNDWLDKPLLQNNAELKKMAEDSCKVELSNLPAKDLVQEVRDRIQSSHEKTPSINTMAKQLFMSTSSFQRKLKQQDITYQEIKQQVLLSEAKRLLILNESSIEYIALTLGFNDASNFSKSFKKWTAMSPSHFRNSHLPKN